jgi:putative ABC transport system substrate-binding protein
MKRREFIALVGGAAIAWPLAARGQRSNPARLGYIWIGPRGSEHSTLDGFRQGMRELGYSEGQDFVIEDRYADSQPTRLPEIAAELVRSKVDLILAPSNPVIKAAMQGTSSIPILATAPDLLDSGVVASLARPGGNVTGISLTAGPAFAEKWVELAKELVPGLAKVGVLWNQGSASSAAYMERIRSATAALGVRSQSFGARNPEEIDRALLEIEAAAPNVLIVETDAMLVSNRARILEFAARHRLPTIYGNPDYMPDGGLMAYAASILDAWRRLATYADKVLKGAKPGDLPVEQATKFRMIVNLKTAKALGITIPTSVLLRADEVIE